jgi:hypothetical protein
VAKAELVIATRPTGDRWTVENDDRGVRTLVERFRRDGATLIVREATGGYELLRVAALAAGEPADGRRESAAGARLRASDRTAREDGSGAELEAIDKKVSRAACPMRLLPSTKG